MKRRFLAFSPNRYRRKDMRRLNYLMNQDTSGGAFLAKIMLMTQYKIPFDQLTDNEKQMANEAAKIMGKVVQDFGISSTEVMKGLSTYE